VSCRLSPDALAGDAWDDDYGDEYEDEDEEDLDEGVAVATGDTLLDLLARLRTCLMRGRCEPLYAVWEQYGYEDEENDEEEAPLRPRQTAAGRTVAEDLAGILESA